MQCPRCNGPTWDNRETKKNPKAPDYKCKEENGECRWQKTKDGWEPSDFPTAVWIPKGATKKASQDRQDAPQQPQLQKSVYVMSGEERGLLLKLVADLLPDRMEALAKEQCNQENYTLNGDLSDTMKMAGRALKRIGSQFDTPNPNIPF